MDTSSFEISCRERILSDNYYDFIVDYRIEKQNTNVKDYCTVMMPTGGFLAYANKNELPPLSIALYGYSIIPKLYTTQDKQALAESGILAIQNGNLQLTGKGVLVGIIDTGISYTNKAFRYSDGNTRIISIWDQTDQTGTPPMLYPYGSVYKSDDINKALNSEKPEQIVPEYDEIGHGTAMAELAAGTMYEGTEYGGAAPDADIAVVKLKEAKEYLREFNCIETNCTAYEETDIMRGHFISERLPENENSPM